MASPGRRATILDPSMNTLHLGVAWNENAFKMVQLSTADTVRMNPTPQSGPTGSPYQLSPTNHWIPITPTSS